MCCAGLAAGSLHNCYLFHESEDQPRNPNGSQAVRCLAAPALQGQGLGLRGWLVTPVPAPGVAQGMHHMPAGFTPWGKAWICCWEVIFHPR